MRDDTRSRAMIGDRERGNDTGSPDTRESNRGKSVLAKKNTAMIPIIGRARTDLVSHHAFRNFLPADVVISVRTSCVSSFRYASRDTSYIVRVVLSKCARARALLFATSFAVAEAETLRISERKDTGREGEERKARERKREVSDARHR